MPRPPARPDTNDGEETCHHLPKTDRNKQTTAPQDRTKQNVLNNSRTQGNLYSRESVSQSGGCRLSGRVAAQSAAASDGLDDRRVLNVTATLYVISVLFFGGGFAFGVVLYCLWYFCMVFGFCLVTFRYGVVCNRVFIYREFFYCGLSEGREFTSGLGGRFYLWLFLWFYLRVGYVC